MPEPKLKDLIGSVVELSRTFAEARKKQDARLAGFETRVESASKIREDLKDFAAEMEKSLKEIKQSVPVKARTALFGADSRDPGGEARGELNKQLRFMLLHAKAPMASPETERKALNIDIGTEGGFLIPTTFRPEIIKKSEKSAIFRPNATVFQNSPPKGDMGAEDGDLTFYYVSDNETITESNPTFKQLAWGLNTIAALSKLSNSLIKWSGLDIGGWLSTKFGRSFAVEEDKQYMSGNGSGKPVGLRNGTGMTTVAQAGANIVIADITALKYTLPQQYRDEAVYILHDNLAEVVEKLKDSQNRPFFVNFLDPLFRPFAFDPKNSRGSLNGSPMYIQNDIPTNLGGGTDESEIFFGPLESYYIWEGGTMEIAASTEADDAFKKNQTHMRMIFDHDGKNSLGEKIAVLTAAK